jgi:hypothetical protein
MFEKDLESFLGQQGRCATRSAFPYLTFQSTEKENL